MNLPPYGRTVKSGVPNLKIFTGIGSWEAGESRASYGHPTLALPPGKDPAQYSWPVKGLSLIVLDDNSPDEYLEQVSTVLLSAGAYLIVIIRNGDPTLFRGKGCVSK